MPPQPTPYVRPPEPQPVGHWLRRGCVALFVERRLPYRASVAWDRLCNALGRRRKTVVADGFEVRVRRLTCDEDFVRNVLLGREYTPDGFEIRESDVVIDVGGNIGTFALLAAKHASRGKVFTCEPNGENYALLLDNVARNRATNVVPIRAAVTGHPGDGKLKLFCTEQGGFHSVLADRSSDPSRYELVDARTLQSIFDEHAIARCHFLKLDCEGAEYDILYNLPPEYLARIDKIAMEYHCGDDPAERRRQSDALAAFLESAGFRIDAYLEFTGFDCGCLRATRV